SMENHGEHYRITTPDDISFNFDFSDITDLQFRPYMLEVAYEYLTLAIHARIGPINEALCALSLEILFKSFNSKVVKNEGHLNERYEFDQTKVKIAQGHCLVSLFEAIPQNIRRHLLERTSDLTLLKKFSNAFTTSRYYYEKSHSGSSTDDLQNLALYAIFKATLMYREKGCLDPFIQLDRPITHYKEVVAARWSIPT
ncbi:MAG: hypothetical protein JNJ84_13385, partial [Rhodobacteraceae bacterium]|nr:hypothetical protein [Paracoccaceae bacterium]